MHCQTCQQGAAVMAELVRAARESRIRAAFLRLTLSESSCSWFDSKGLFILSSKLLTSGFTWPQSSNLSVDGGLRSKSFISGVAVAALELRNPNLSLYYSILHSVSWQGSRWFETWTKPFLASFAKLSKCSNFAGIHEWGDPFLSKSKRSIGMVWPAFSKCISKANTILIT